MLRGKVAAPPQNFHLGDAFVVDGSGAIRVTGAILPDGQAALAVGDSVMVIGTAGTDLGQPVVRDGTITSFGNKPAPLARITTVAEARTANGGAIDAALVQVSGIRISDTTQADPDYEVTVESAVDPADKVVVVIEMSSSAFWFSYVFVR